MTCRPSASGSGHRSSVRARRQLTQQAERRRVVEAGGKHAAGELERLRLEAGRAPAREAALREAREAEAGWRGEAVRCMHEVRPGEP